MLGNFTTYKYQSGMLPQLKLYPGIIPQLFFPDQLIGSPPLPDPMFLLVATSTFNMISIIRIAKRLYMGNPNNKSLEDLFVKMFPHSTLQSNKTNVDQPLSFDTAYW